MEVSSVYDDIHNLSVKAVKNKQGDISVEFDFYTYTFPKGKTVLVEEDIEAHLKERYPLVFEFDIKSNKKTKGKPITKVQKEKTESRLPVSSTTPQTQDMYVSTGEVKPTFGLPDEDGLVGPGVEIEGA